MDEVAAIQVQALCAGYGKKEILHSLDITIAAGQWTVLLGPNGSGKTTFMRTLMGLLKPFSGTARMCCQNVYDDRRELKQVVGYVAEEPYLYRELNAIQHLRFAGDMHGLKPKLISQRAEKLLGQFNLLEVARQPLAEYSMGMRRKVALSMAMIHEPRVLILDEPLNGLDPAVAQECRRGLRQLCDEQGTTILMSTHNLGMMHHYSDLLLVISEGALLAQAPPAELRTNYPGYNLEEVFLKLVGIKVDDEQPAAACRTSE